MRKGTFPLLTRINANTHSVSPSFILWLTFLFFKRALEVAIEILLAERHLVGQ
jgi:hypothetical protein